MRHYRVVEAMKEKWNIPRLLIDGELCVSGYSVRDRISEFYKYTSCTLCDCNAWY